MLAVLMMVLTVGWVRTSETFSPRHQTCLPSFKLSRYCSTVLIIGNLPLLLAVKGP
jgi:hypothetical protein